MRGSCDPGGVDIGWLAAGDIPNPLQRVPLLVLRAYVYVLPGMYLFYLIDSLRVSASPIYPVRYLLFVLFCFSSLFLSFLPW